MADVTVWKSASTPESLQLPLADWLLIDDLCTYARTHFEAPDAETQARFVTALDRIQETIDDLCALRADPSRDPSALTDEQRTLLQASTPSREVH